MKQGIYFLLIGMTAMLSVSCFGQQQPYRPTFDMRIPHAPAIVNIDNKITVYYELWLTNFSPDTLRLNSLDILDAKDSTHYLTVNGTALKRRLGLIGVKDATPGLSMIYPGASAVIYIEFAPDKEPAEIIHEIRFTDESHEFTIRGAITGLVKQPAIVLGSPLHHGPWCAIYEPSWERGHRRVIFTIDGKARIPGRFAIDFMKLDETGRYASKNEDSIAQWFGYGADVLAVADGVVAAARDDFSESPTLSGHPGYSSDMATGNYVSLRIDDHAFVFYEHLKPGSVRVKPGQRVKKGDVIAAVGFTGQTTGPHLHLHVADSNSPLGAEGLPFVFDHYQLLGGYDNFDDFGKIAWTKPAGDPDRKRQRPAPNTVIAFK